MRRWIPLMALALAALLAGCAGEQALELDSRPLAQDLMDGEVFGETLYELDEAAADLLVGTELNGEETVAYVGTGATSEELLIVKSADEAAAETCLATLQSHLEDRKALYASYLPEESFKLENAYLAQEGQYVILCVAADSDKAAEIIGEAIKE